MVTNLGNLGNWDTIVFWLWLVPWESRLLWVVPICIVVQWAGICLSLLIRTSLKKYLPPILLYLFWTCASYHQLHAQNKRWTTYSAGPSRPHQVASNK
jgi:hypothetical protein